MAEASRPLTPTDRDWIFRQATAALPKRYSGAIAAGMTDAELEDALQEMLGIFGGSGGPGRPSIAFTGAGLRIWGGWHGINHVTEKPLFAGKATIAKAREIHGIADPEDRQLPLL